MMGNKAHKRERDREIKVWGERWKREKKAWVI
jgi:hypothetical protein